MTTKEANKLCEMVRAFGEASRSAGRAYQRFMDDKVTVGELDKSDKLAEQSYIKLVNYIDSLRRGQRSKANEQG